MKREFNYWLAVATIIGTVIGAGVLGMPYAISRAGFIPGLILTLLIGFCMTLLLLYVAEIALRSHRVHQLPGLVRKYLGKRWANFMFILFVIGVYGALISYIVGVSEILSMLTGFNQLFYQALFVILAGLPVYLGLRFVQKSEFILVGVLLVSIIIICLAITPQINPANLARTDWLNFFYPYGVIFFALTGYSVMPELEQMLSKQRSSIMKSIITAMIICTMIYLFFSLVFIGVFGTSVAEVSTESLTGLIGLFGNTIAVISMTTSFIALSMAVLDTYVKDYKVGRSQAWVLTIVVPFLITVFLKPDFIQPIMISGAYSGTLTGFLILGALIKSRQKKGDKPAFTTPFGKAGLIAVGLVFLLGLLFTILNLLGL